MSPGDRTLLGSEQNMVGFGSEATMARAILTAGQQPPNRLVVVLKTFLTRVYDVYVYHWVWPAPGGRRPYAEICLS
jgi:hypothetical protein